MATSAADSVRQLSDQFTEATTTADFSVTWWSNRNHYCCCQSEIVKRPLSRSSEKLTVLLVWMWSDSWNAVATVTYGRPLLLWPLLLISQPD